MGGTVAALLAGPHRNDEVFVPGAGPQGGEFYLPYTLIRDELRRYGIELHTADLCREGDVAFELHVNAQRQVPDRPAYAYLYEDPLVRPRNAESAVLVKYRRCFTWNDEVVDGQRVLKLDIPNELSHPPFTGWEQRDLFCVMIASNKALLRPDPRGLHHRRVRTARHFEAHAPELFSLYGAGWDQPGVRPGVWGRALKRLHEWRARLVPGPPAFPSWKGRLDSKSDILRRARFSIAYENVRGSRGYITEKIFDCFVHGCIPVYLGTPGATAAIPPDCFVDADHFSSEAALLDHLRSIDRERHAAMQSSIAAFLDSPAAQRYTRRFFARTLVEGIASDLGLQPTLPRELETST